MFAARLLLAFGLDDVEEARRALKRGNPNPRVVHAHAAWELLKRGVAGAMGHSISIRT